MLVVQHHTFYIFWKPISATRGKNNNLYNISENKITDQLNSNCEAKQSLCFHYRDSTFLNQNLQPLAIICACTDRFVSDLFENNVDFPMMRLTSSLDARQCSSPELCITHKIISKSMTLTSRSLWYQSRGGTA